MQICCKIGEYWIDGEVGRKEGDIEGTEGQGQGGRRGYGALMWKREKIQNRYKNI